MDDVKYLYFQDMKEKKTTAKGAYHKKGGSKSKKCTLYYETLKGAERKKYMESKTETTNLLNADYKGNYCKLPPDKQKIQLEFLLERYHYRVACIKEFFDVAQNTAWRILERHGLMKKVKLHTESMTRSEYGSIINLAKEDRAAFFADDTSTDEITQNPPEESPTEPSTVSFTRTVNDIPDTPDEIKGGTVTFKVPCNDTKFNFVMNTTVTGETFEKRVRGLSEAMDKDGHYKVTVLIREV